LGAAVVFFELDDLKGLEMVKRQLAKEVIDGRTYWLPSSTLAVKRPSRVAYLLPAFDEYHNQRSSSFQPVAQLMPS